MPDEVTKPKIPAGTKALIRKSDRILNIPQEQMDRLQAFLGSEIPRLRAGRDEKMERIRRWRTTLKGENPSPPVASGISNVSVPLTMKVRSSVHKKLVRGVFGQRPFIAFEQLSGGSAEVFGDTPVKQVLKSLSKLMEHLILDPRAFNGKAMIRRVAADMTDTGLGAWVARETPDILIQIPPAEAGEGGDKATDVETDVQFGSIKWDPIAFEHLLAYDNFGTDSRAMPFIGHRIRKTLNEIMLWASPALNHYDPKAVESVKAYYEDPKQANLPAEKRNHWVDEIYTDFDITGRGLLAPIIVDWHEGVEVILRVAWNRLGGHRPILLTQFDTPADPHALQGQGVCEKLESPQIEANTLHNIAVESVKRSINLTVVRSDSAIAEELDGQPVIPSQVYATENIEEDIKTFVLAQPRIGEVLLGFEQVNHQYALELMGIGAAQLGDVKTAQRVSTQLGAPIMREGQIFIEDPLESIANAMIESIYLSLDIMRRKPPLEAMKNILTEDEFTALSTTVFGGEPATRRESLRSSIGITVKARDVAAMQSARKNELLMLSQVLTTYNDKLTQTIQISAMPDEQVPPAAKQALFHLAEKMGASIEAFVRTMDSIDDPAEVLADIGELRKMLGVSEASTTNNNTRLSAVPEADDDEIDSRGAGVV